ncbi:exosortase family protein XrtF [Lacinutrix chionoecetis]
MKDLVVKYKSVIKFIVTFLLVYIGLSIVYKLYLNASTGSLYYPDYITNLVAYQSEALLNTVGYKAEVIKHPLEPSMKLIVRGKYLARIIEGCNAVSVIILFVAFVIAFSGKLKTTFLFLLAGSVIIYIVNLVRIVILSVGLYHYPWRSDILHSVVFPAIIYGIVFLLWMLWVNRFSNIGKNNG